MLEFTEFFASAVISGVIVVNAESHFPWMLYVAVSIPYLVTEMPPYTEQNHCHP